MWVIKKRLVLQLYPNLIYLYSELLERYSRCKTSAEVIAAQDQWLEAERRAAVRDDSIDYPPSCSSSGSSDSEVEESGGDDDSRRENEPPLSGNA